MKSHGAKLFVVKMFVVNFFLRCNLPKLDEKDLTNTEVILYSVDYLGEVMFSQSERTVKIQKDKEVCQSKYHESQQRASQNRVHNTGEVIK
jgi:hypothetical protein